MMITYPVILQLTSTTLSRSELEAGLSLIRAFFPGAKVEIEEAGAARVQEQEHLHHWENAHQEKGVEEDFHGSGRESRNASLSDGDTECVVKIDVDIDVSKSYHVHGEFYSTQERLNVLHVTLSSQQVERILVHPQVGKESERKLLLKHGLFHLLAQVTQHTPPWGILTGIRPSKILHRLEDLALTEALETRVLQEHYAIREDKIRLLQEIVAIQRPYLKEIMDHPEQVAVYVGIPFCPTRCTYCSFPAYSLQQGREPLRAYLEGLYKEIQVTGEWMKETGRRAASLYLGGGTPTILSTSEISNLLQWVHKNIPLPVETEFSVEAGRPDTLSKEKLQALQEQGVNRLSINPQTMHDRTLKRIGRAHTVENVLRIYELARAISNWTINMDLILGLPGETVSDVRESLKRIRELKPDNLTVHALAIKRGSKEHEAGLIQNLSSELDRMQELVLVNTRSFGLRPYYLYRQKHIAGNLENIGFARPGAECRYNIGIMEERQSVIGIGAGASSKVLNPEDYSLVNLQHPSNWQVYLERWPEIHQKRMRAFI